MDQIKKTIEKMEISKRELEESLELLYAMVDDEDKMPLVMSIPKVRLNAVELDLIDIMRNECKDPSRQSDLMKTVLSTLFKPNFRWEDLTVESLRESSDELESAKISACIQYMKDIYKDEFRIETLNELIAAKSASEKMKQKFAAANKRFALKAKNVRK